MSAPTVAGLVLAGGRSRRMGGGDKFLLPLTGRRLIDHVVARLAPQVGALAISANCDPALLADTGLPVLADAPPSRGPLSGLLAGMSWAATALPGCTHVATAAADTPFFPEDLVARLMEAGAGTGSATLAVSAGRVHPVFGLWPLAGRRYLEEFLASSEKWRMIDFAGRTGWREVDFPVSGDSDPFFNINTPGDLAAAQRRMEHG